MSISSSTAFQHVCSFQNYCQNTQCCTMLKHYFIMSSFTQLCLFLQHMWLRKQLLYPKIVPQYFKSPAASQTVALLKTFHKNLHSEPCQTEMERKGKQKYSRNLTKHSQPSMFPTLILNTVIILHCAQLWQTIYQSLSRISTWAVKTVSHSSDNI